MTFVTLIFKNLLRQRVRTGLTIVGISIGITTVVALGVITGGMKATMADLASAGGSDIMFAQKGSSDLTFSTVSVREWEAVAAHSGIAWAHGVLLHVTKLGSNPYFAVFGIRPADLAASPPDLDSGTLPALDATDQAIIGRRAAADLRLGVGDTLTIDERPFRIVGIYHTGGVWQDSGAYLPLGVVQEIAAKPDQVTAVYVKIAPGYNIREVARSVEDELPTLTAIIEVSDYSKVDQGLRIIDALNMAISVLAVGIGAIGVMNTMIMSVYERTREIGILRAVGWSGRRILRMIIGESLLLCVAAAVLGSALGILATRAVMLIAIVRAFVEPQYTMDVFLRALAVAVIVSLAGAAYPAFRAVRLTPMEALRHE